MKVPSDFAEISFRVGQLLKLYVGHIGRNKKIGEPFSTPYDAHTLVRAVETLFYGQLACVTGVYISVCSGSISVEDEEKMVSLRYSSYSHSWLCFKENKDFILDVIPVYGIFGATQVTPLCVRGNHFGYLSSNDIDPKYWSEEQKQKMRIEVNELSDVLQNLQSFYIEMPS